MGVVVEVISNLHRTTTTRAVAWEVADSTATMEMLLNTAGMLHLDKLRLSSMVLLPFFLLFLAFSCLDDLSVCVCRYGMQPAWGGVYAPQGMYFAPGQYYGPSMPQVKTS